MIKTLLTTSLCTTAILFSHTASATPLSLDVEALYMSQKGSGATIPSSITSGAPYNTDNLADSWGAGAEIAAGFKPDVWGGEVRGMTFDIDSNDTFIGNTAVVTVAISPPPPSTTAAGDPYAISLSTSLKGFEMNALYDSNTGIEYFAGLRSIQLDDDLKMTAYWTTATYEMNWKSSNQLVGAHVGAAVKLDTLFAMTGQLHPQLRVGIGAYGNSMDHAAYNLYNGTLWSTTVTNVSDSARSYTLDLDLSARYNLAPNTALYAGYRLLYLRGVTLAANLVDASSTGLTSDNTIFHGVKAGVAMQF